MTVHQSKQEKKKKEKEIKEIIDGISLPREEFITVYYKISIYESNSIYMFPLVTTTIY